MVGSLIFRMILWDLFKVFLLSLITITGILLLAGIIAEATQQGLGPKQILGAIPLLIPSTLPYTIPATTLFASCIVYGRLAANHEILAIKAAGCNLVHIVTPGLILGGVMSGLTLGLYYRTIPETHHKLRAMIFDDLEELLYGVLKKNGAVNHPQTPYAMYVRSVQGRKLLNPVFKRKTPKGYVDMVARAREAELRVDRANRLMLLDMRFGVATSDDGSQGVFDRKTFDFPIPPGLDRYENRRPRDMTWEEMVERRRELIEEVEHTNEELGRASQEMEQPGARPDLPQHVANLREKIRQANILRQHIYVEMLMRPALSIGCLCFILAAAPIAIWFSRGDYLGSFITCFLPVVCVYYPLVLAGTNLAKEARFNEIVLVYGPNALIALAGLALMRWLIRY
ncbi:MAG: LptF/LptG family permease [Gemmataceae bacterium]